MTIALVSSLASIAHLRGIATILPRLTIWRTRIAPERDRISPCHKVFEPMMMTVSDEVIKTHVLNLSLARNFGS